MTLRISMMAQRAAALTSEKGLYGKDTMWLSKYR